MVSTQYLKEESVYKRRLMPTLLSLLMVFSLLLAACGGGAPAAPADAPAEEAAEAAPTEAAAEEAAPEEAASEEEGALGSTLIGEIEGPDIITDESQFPTELKQAPMFDEMSDLPAVADRLPVQSDLLVIQPVHEIGTYGGTWRRGFTGPGDGQNGHRVAGMRKTSQKWCRTWPRAGKSMRAAARLSCICAKA
jgi:hypothetical protein